MHFCMYGKPYHPNLVLLEMHLPSTPTSNIIFYKCFYFYMHYNPPFSDNMLTNGLYNFAA